MGRTVVIIQARMGSSRLPGKVLLQLGDTTVLGHVLRRSRAIRGADLLCCAIPDNHACDPIAIEAQRHGALVFRGDENDVLARYHGAAVMTGADVVLRITSDCPLIDPGICDAVLELRRDQAADYASNNMPPSFPHGLDCEAFTMDILARANQQAILPREREHVTPWMRESTDIKRANLTGPGGDAMRHRWTLDYPEDLLFLQSLFERFPVAATASSPELARILGAHPEIAELNAIHRGSSRPASALSCEGKPA